MQRNPNEERTLDDAIDRLLSIRPVKTEAEELVEKCTALRLAVGGVLSKELSESVGDESVSFAVLLDGHWSATELVYWSATLYHPEVWSALASDPAFAKIVFLPMREPFHGAETVFGTIVWASHADPETLTESDIEQIRICYVQVSACFSRLTWQFSVVLDVIENLWQAGRPKRNWNAVDDIYFASRVHDVMPISAGQQGCRNDFGDEMIEYRINKARTAFAQIAIQGLLIRGFPIRVWEHFLEPLFSRWFSEYQSLYTSAQIAEVAEVLRGGEELPASITSRYSESELTVARTAINIDIEEGLNGKR